MAFATTNVQGGAFAGPVKFYCGDWSGTAGDAPGTLTLAGGRVYLHSFRNEDTTSPAEEPDATAAYSAGTITLTIYNHQTIANGRFFIIYA